VLLNLNSCYYIRRRWHLESLLVGPTLEGGEISLVTIHVLITLTRCYFEVRKKVHLKNLN
jgi:hypothetical protein